jgi:hypothetical protein
MSFSYNITQLKSDLTSSLHGTTLNKVQNVYGLIQRAGADLLLELDPQETKRIAELASPIFSKVYDYYLPDDLKGTKIIDIRPQANRTMMDRYVQEYNQAFSIGKGYTSNPNFTIQYNTGFKTIRIDNNLLIQGISLNTAESITGDGTWVLSGNATNLREDNLQFVDGTNSSLAFDTTGTQAILTNSTITPIDCSGQENQSQIFFFAYLPVASQFSTIQIKWGSSTSAYWTQTLNSTNVGTTFNNGWNLLDADWESASVVGSPDNTKISYLQITYNYTGAAQTGVRLNSIYSRLGVISEIEYYSKDLFSNASTGAFQETILSDNDIINLDTESRNLLFLLVGTYMVQQVQGLDAMFFDSNFFGQKYAQALAHYKSQYKSEWQKPRSTYYNVPNPSNQRFNGGRLNY